MANQTTLVSGNHSCLLEISNLAVTNLAIDPELRYSVKHLGLNNAGNASTTVVKMSTDGSTPDPTAFAAIENQRILQAGDVEFPKRGGVSGMTFGQIRLKAANHASAVLVQVAVIESTDRGTEG